MYFDKKLLSCFLTLLLISSTSFAATKRVIDQGMLDGQRRYIIACDNGKQMFFIKKFTAPEQGEVLDESELPEPGESAGPASDKQSEFIESCLQTQDDRGDFCRSDSEWSARDAGVEFCQ